MRHVLVVDDDPDVSAVMQAALEADGDFRVTVKVGASDALRVIAEDRPEAAIIDALLFGMSGLELAEAALGSGVPTLIVSGHPDVANALTCHGCRFLQKPFPLRTLVEETRALLAEAGRRQAELERQLERLMGNAEALREAGLAARATTEASRAARAERERLERERKERGPGSGSA